MKYTLDESEIRIYNKSESCIFKKNEDEFGALSNMATKFPISVNGISIKTTEALYQACRFPHLPDIQKKIIGEKSPMKVKMLSNANKKNSRSDWDEVRIKIMKWCINIKLAQNFLTFGEELHKTGMNAIVENSTSDNFWGAIPNEDGSIFKGKNALGRLLMDLRQKLFGRTWLDLFYIESPPISNFLILNEPIHVIDERLNFIQSLINYWSVSGNINQLPQFFTQGSFKIDTKINNLGINILQSNLFGDDNI